MSPQRHSCRALIAFAQARDRLRLGQRVRLSQVFAEMDLNYRRLRHEHPHIASPQLDALVSDVLRTTMAPKPAQMKAMFQEPALPPLGRVSARMAAALPVLRQFQTPGEARQLAKLTRQADRSSLLRRGLAASGANLRLARRDYAYPDGDAGYVVPGRNGSVCRIHLHQGSVIGLSCGRIGKRTEQDGVLGMMVVKGGYEVYGGLPTGTKLVRITDAKHRVYEVPVNRWGGFDFTGKGVMMGLEALMPDGRWKAYESGPFPPPPPPPPPKPPSRHRTSTGR